MRELCSGKLLANTTCKSKFIEKLIKIQRNFEIYCKFDHEMQKYAILGISKFEILETGTTSNYTLTIQLLAYVSN